MADLNALIARGYQSQPLPDPFVQYSKMQQLENSATQNRLAQQQMQENAQMAPFRLQEAQENAQMAPLRMQEMQAKLGTAKLTFDEAKQARDVVDGLMAKSAENGGPTDPIETIKFLISHPNSRVQQMGKTMADSYKLLQEFELQQKFNQGETGGAAPAAAPTAAYTPQRILVGSQSVQPSALGSGTFDVNAPAVAAPAAAAPAAPTDKLGKIQARIDYLTQFINIPQAKSQREDLIKQRDELSKPHVVGNVMLNGVGDVIYKGPAKSSIQQRVNANQDTEFVSVDDETKEATPILIDGQPLISARKIDRKIMGNLLLDDTGKVIFEGPAGSTIQQVTKGNTISFVSVDNKTHVATPITQDGKPLTGDSIPAQELDLKKQDLAFRQQKAAFEQAHPTLSIQRVGQSDGSEIIVAVNTQNATYQPVVAQGDTFVPAGPAMPISAAAPSAAAPSAAAPSAASTTAPLAAPLAAAIVPEAGAAPAAVRNAFVDGAVNNALLSTSTGAGRPLISAAKPVAVTTSTEMKNADALAQLKGPVGSFAYNEEYAKQLARLTAKSEGATSTEMKNAEAFALLKGPVGSPAYTQEFAKQLARLTAKSEGAVKDDPNLTVASTQVDNAGNVTFYNKFGKPINIQKGAGKPSATFEKTAAAKVNLARDLDQAIAELTAVTKDGGLIDQSTGSGVGRAVDIGARFIGKAMPGDIAIGKLQPIADLALKMIPRFEGPQSNADTTSYKQAAGQLADPTLPPEIRKAAGKTVLRLMIARKGQFTTADIPAEGAGAAGESAINAADAILNKTRK